MDIPQVEQSVIFTNISNTINDLAASGWCRQWRSRLAAMETRSFISLLQKRSAGARFPMHMATVSPRGSRDLEEQNSFPRRFGRPLAEDALAAGTAVTTNTKSVTACPHLSELAAGCSRPTIWAWRTRWGVHLHHRSKCVCVHAETASTHAARISSSD